MAVSRVSGQSNCALSDCFIAAVPRNPSALNSQGTFSSRANPGPARCGPSNSSPAGGQSICDIRGAGSNNMQETQAQA
jgi:hypothetical protein